MTDIPGASDVAAAILTLANVIDRKKVLDTPSSENFGHELALALKNVLEEKQLSVIATIEQ